MSSVNVICASPYGRNSGMASVDMSFAGIADQLGINTTTYWRLWDQSEVLDVEGGSYMSGAGTWYDPDTGLEYQNLRGRLAEALDSDAMVFWGDFFHLARAQLETGKLFHEYFGIDSNLADAIAEARKYLLLTETPASVLERVASFGTTLRFNDPIDYDAAYGQDIEKFVNGVGAIAMRDAFSAGVVRRFRGEYGRSFEAADLAFLLEPADPGPRSGLGVFFGRSSLRAEKLALFGRKLARQLDEPPQWFDWGRQPGLWPIYGRRFRAVWPELEHGSVRGSSRDLLRTYRSVIDRGPALSPGGSPTTPVQLDQLASLSCLVTDTYHLALNAWRVGTPTICVLDDPGADWSVNSGSPANRRDKRWDLYSSLDALAFTVDGHQLGRRLSREAERVAAVVKDVRAVDRVRSNVDDRATQARSVVRDGMRKVLGPLA